MASAGSQALKVAGATVVAGSLDLAFAFTLNDLAGTSPVQVLRYIASGLLGVPAFAGAAGSAPLVGVLCHYALMVVFVAIVAVVIHLVPESSRHRLLLATLAGVGLFVTMNGAVVPLSNAPELPWPPLWRFAAELAAHVGLVALPAVFVLTAGRGDAGVN